MTRNVYTKLQKNVLSPEMMKVKKHFFSLINVRDGWLKAIRVIPFHGPNKGEQVIIPSSDIYSVLAYKEGKACLRVSKKCAAQQGGLSLPGHRDGLIFVSGDLDYMNALFYKDANQDALLNHITQDDINSALDALDEVRRMCGASPMPPHP